MVASAEADNALKQTGQINYDDPNDDTSTVEYSLSISNILNLSLSLSLFLLVFLLMNSVDPCLARFQGQMIQKLMQFMNRFISEDTLVCRMFLFNSFMKIQLMVSNPSF